MPGFALLWQQYYRPLRVRGNSVKLTYVLM